MTASSLRDVIGLSACQGVAAPHGGTRAASSNGLTDPI